MTVSLNSSSNAVAAYLGQRQKEDLMSTGHQVVISTTTLEIPVYLTVSYSSIYAHTGKDLPPTVRERLQRDLIMDSWGHIATSRSGKGEIGKGD